MLSVKVAQPSVQSVKKPKRRSTSKTTVRSRSSARPKAAEAARQRVLGITAEAEIGKIYIGKVERIVDFGAFVNILPGKDGLVHISMLSDAVKVTDILKEGQEVEVLVLDVDNRGRIKLSIKDVAAAKALGAIAT